ncbi:M56 family metallopeptidase [uncultured Polaribacter sp.]|uniref:M56 family metallopeptidase n=1 Tax=uncultured Polaribacter sp. TaxID=174711 RepID=UPI00262A54E8|nr:M56 family metallopeptidase [uncultured Polaribacter sp.]
MIVYLLKSASCLALLLFFYHLVLEREKMHNFNRFYLLIGVVFSFLAPLITFTTYVKATTYIQPEIVKTPFTEEFTPIIIEESTVDYSQILFGIYLTIVGVFLFRFGRNLFKIVKKIKTNKNVAHQKATLVLVDDNILPHSFWNYIFINKTAYESGKIEAELFTHELTHVTQKHTFDVLLIELLQAVFWINPLFIFLKKAIQLNHEFLADENVINQHKNTHQYQHLLLNKASWNNEYYLASNLNYSLTKKRLKMMTAQSSRTKVLFKKLAVIPLLIGFVFLFAERVEAQEKEEETIEIVETVSINDTKLEETEIYKEYVYRNLKVVQKDKNGNKISKTYAELNTEEKARLMTPPLKLKKIVPTQKQLNDLKNEKNFAVWIDGKVVNNTALNHYKNTDFARYSNSYVHKNARSKRFPQKNQAHLETTKYFENQNKIRFQNYRAFFEKKHGIQIINIKENSTKADKKYIEEKKKLKNNYIDSPVIQDKIISLNNMRNEVPSFIEEIRKNNATKESRKVDSLKKDNEVTPEEMKTYTTLFNKGKKYKFYKVKDVNKMKDIYNRMSKKQKLTVESVFNLVPSSLFPKPDWIYTYNRLANKVKRTSENRKANLIRLKEIYNKKMTDAEKLKVTAPHLLVPPPPTQKVLKGEKSDIPLSPKNNNKSKIKQDTLKKKPKWTVTDEVQFLEIEENDKNIDEINLLSIIINRPELESKTKNYFVNSKKVTRNDLDKIDKKYIETISISNVSKNEVNLHITLKQKKELPSSFRKKYNAKEDFVFNSVAEVKKQKETTSKLSDNEKRQFLLRKTIIQATTYKATKFNFKIDKKVSKINDVYSYLHNNPLCNISTSKNKDGIQTLLLNNSSSKKMSESALQNIYTEVFNTIK